MEIHSLKPFLVVIGLLIVTSLALAFTVDVSVVDEAGIKMELPDQIEGWKGDEMRFCQAPACQKDWGLSQVTNRDECPKCGGKLDSMSKAERDLLPADTLVLKKRYTDGSGHLIFASIVMSGRERASIHRPQVCLVGQGNEIVNSDIVSVPLPGREPLDIMVLDMLKRWRAPDGRQRDHTSYYAYWFVGKGRETPSHFMRMFWMASDRIFHNRSHRWAYISVSGERDEKDAYRKEIQSFVSQLYPGMTLN